MDAAIASELRGRKVHSSTALPNSGLYLFERGKEKLIIQSDRISFFLHRFDMNSWKFLLGKVEERLKKEKKLFSTLQNDYF